MDECVVSRFDTAMIGVGCFVRADRRVLEISCFLLVNEDFDVLSKRALIPL